MNRRVAQSHAAIAGSGQVSDLFFEALARNPEASMAGRFFPRADVVVGEDR
jgi:hypothetical protein